LQRPGKQGRNIDFNGEMSKYQNCLISRELRMIIGKSTDTPLTIGESLMSGISV
jgi:hypothetical protein